MHQRMLLKIEPYFTELFFADVDNSKDSVSFIPSVNFPLPQSSEQYPLFYASLAGVQFRIGAITLIKEMVSYLGDRLPLYKEHVEIFIHKYIDYAGGDAGININNFIIYSQGIPFLKGINDLLKELHISLDKKSDLVEELIKHFGVCGPGVSRHIADTYLKLKAMQNIRDEFSLFRLEASQQVVTMGLKTLEREYIGSDIHYVNAITNHYAAILGFRELEDAYIKSCNEHVLGYLYAYFNQFIRKALSLDNLLSKIIASLDLDNWVMSLQKAYAEHNMPAYNAAMTSIEERLAIYGHAELGVDALLLIDDDFVIKGLQYDAIEKIKINLVNRFSESGYLMAFDWKIMRFNDNFSMYYLLQQPMYFFYVTFHGVVHPFTRFFRNSILKNLPEKEVIHAKLTLLPGFLLQFLENLAKYTASVEFTNMLHSQEEIDRLLEYLLQEGKDCWYILLNHMSQQIGIKFIKKLLKNFVDDAVMMEVIHIYYFYPLFEKRALIINALLGNQDVRLVMDNNRYSVLHYACLLKLPLTAQFFIEQQADIEARDKAGKTPLFYAASANAPNVLRVLLMNQANVDAVDNQGKTALMLACEKGNSDAVVTLLQYGARVNLVDNDKIHALQYACACGSLTIVNLLLQYNANVNAYDADTLEDSPLSLAVDGGYKDIVYALFNAGVIFNLKKRSITKLFTMLDIENDSVVIIKAMNDLLDAYLKEVSAKQDIINLRLFNEEQMLAFLSVINSDDNTSCYDTDLTMRRCAKYAVAKAILDCLDLESSCSMVADSVSYESLLWNISKTNSYRISIFAETYFKLATKGLVKNDYLNMR